MESAAADRERKARTFVEFCMRRLDDQLEEERIAEEMGFGSAKALYKQLENEGSPVCGVCGVLYPEPGHREGHEDEKPKKGERQLDLRGIRQVELPNAGRAYGLFCKALDELASLVHFTLAEESWLAGDTEEGEFKGKHFITQFVDRNPQWKLRREGFTKEEWATLCERHDADRAAEEITLPRGSAAAGGVARTPSVVLTALVVAYVLSGLPLRPLVEALHREPSAAKWDKLRDNVKNLRKVAGHLAVHVRGGVVERGRGIEEASEYEHLVAWGIQTLRAQAEDSTEKLYELVKKDLGPFADDLTVDTVRRMRYSGLKPPE